MEADSDRRRSDLPRAHPFGLHDRAAQQPVVHTISFVWQHVLVWGGLRGALSLALALSLDSAFPYRDEILNLTFGVVVFSILIQGLSIKPLLAKAPAGVGDAS